MTRPLKIWLPAISTGSGSEVFTGRLAEGLRKAGHQPIVQWFAHRDELMPWRLLPVQPPPGTDMVHAASWQGFAFKRTGIPLVVTEHQYVPHPAFAPWRSRWQWLYHRGFIEPCMRRSFVAAAAVVAVSEFCAAPMREDLHRPIDVIHNWVDTKLFAPSDAVRNASENRPMRLLFVGNPSRWKGADILPALATQLGDGYEIQCLGGLRKGFKQQALPPNMRLLPRVAPAAMPELYRSVDIALVPTRYEAFGYVALEAMASGLPVAGFASAATAEVCADGETALLAPLDDVAGLVAHCRRLASDTDLRARLGAAGRRRAEACFGESRAIAAYLDVYKMALAGKPQHA